METKRKIYSKTLWLNALAGIAVIVQAITGQEWLDAEGQAAIIVVANIILRFLTKQPITIR